MDGTAKAPVELAIGHVLFIDIVGYSKLSTADQNATVATLNELVRESEFIQVEEKSSRVLKIPTGDDMVVEALARQPDDYTALSSNAFLNVALGNKQEALRAAKRAVDLYPVSRDAFVGPERIRVLAMVCSLASEKDLAFETLYELLGIHNQTYLFSAGIRHSLKIDPIWDNLRDDSRFNDLLAQAATK